VTRDPQSFRRQQSGLILLSCLVLALGAAAWGILSRLDAEAALVRVTDEAALPIVATVVAQAGPAEEEVVLPGTVQAEYDTTIYARTSGYVKRWYVDIGARVRAGDLLAEIDSPEVDQQLAQARAQLVQMQAALAQSQASEELAKVTTGRSTLLVRQGWTSQQQGDQDRLTHAGSVAAVAVARANMDAQEAQVRRLEQLTGFERVVAPFDGVITSRQVDIGNLINAGSGAGPELFRVADTSKLRIYVQVPQSYAASIKPGLEVDLRFPEYPGRTFPASFVRSANAIEPRARTLLVELDADNAKGELLSGGYTDVHFKLPIADRGVRVSANALLFRAEGLQIATAGPDGHVVLHAVTLGRDFGTAVEVLTGIAPGDAVVLNPPASLATGGQVLLHKDDKLASRNARSLASR
jgi:RND family efflux transporter MFP subunit